MLAHLYAQVKKVSDAVTVAALPLTLLRRVVFQRDTKREVSPERLHDIFRFRLPELRAAPFQSSPLSRGHSHNNAACFHRITSILC